MRIIIYTINLNDYDNYNELDFLNKDVKFIYIADKDVKIKGFSMRNIDYKSIHSDSGKAARYFKCNPNIISEDYDYSIYVDASFKIKNIDFHKAIKSLGDFDIAQFKHPERNCSYEESKLLLTLGRFKDQHEQIKKQNTIYKQLGFPPNFGLACGGFIIRKHSDKVDRFNEMWWSEIKNGSKRDQVSEMFCVWESNVKMKYIEGDIYNNKFVKFNNSNQN